MADPIRVLVRRGSTVESVHDVHAVAVQDGAVVAEWGDTSLVTFLRSSAKPLQALPLVREVPGLTDAEVAIACASHRAGPDHLEAVRSLLRRAAATEGDLECGPAGEPPSRLNNNCSGKHAGMLLLARSRAWEREGYRLARHPVQREMLSTVAAAVDARPEELPTAVDGCGVVTFALPLERMALAFSRFVSLDGGQRAADAMRAHPHLVCAEGAPDTVLMQQLDGWIAKGGAEGLMCAAGPDGLGLALKITDGNARAIAPALAAVVGELGQALPSLASVPVANTRGETVGEVVVDF